MAISRTREYAADQTSAVATPATAHLFIVNPFAGKSLMKLFSTHPSTEDRIARLEQWHRR